MENSTNNVSQQNGRMTSNDFRHHQRPVLPATWVVQIRQDCGMLLTMALSFLHPILIASVNDAWNNSGVGKDALVHLITLRGKADTLEVSRRNSGTRDENSIHLNSLNGTPGIRNSLAA